MRLKHWNSVDPYDECQIAPSTTSPSVDPTVDIAHLHQADCEVAALYRSEAPRLARFFRFRIPRLEDVPDLVQRSFVRLLGLDPARRAALEVPEAYLSTVALNLVRDDAKTASRRSESLHMSIDDVPEGVSDPHPQLEARDMLARLDAAMLALPLRTREIFMAHRFDELTYGEIAAKTGLSVKSVERHMSLALRELRRLLADDA